MTKPMNARLKIVASMGELDSGADPTEIAEQSSYHAEDRRDEDALCVNHGFPPSLVSGEW